MCSICVAQGSVVEFLENFPTCLLLFSRLRQAMLIFEQKKCQCLEGKKLISGEFSLPSETFQKNIYYVLNNELIN